MNSRFTTIGLVLLLSGTLATSATAADAPVAPKPAPAPVSKSAPSAPTAPAPAVEPKPLDLARKGVVILERANRPLALGSVLSGDGRILTALSPLGHGNQIDVRYADGRLAHARIMHADRGSDLALLAPDNAADGPGLKASHDPTPEPGNKLSAFGFVSDKALAPNVISIKAKSMLRGGDSALLGNVLEFVNAPKAQDIGGPLLNEQGEVVAIIARACASSDTTGCTLTPYGAPVSAVRAFLRSVPERAGAWLGVDAVAFDAGPVRGVRVVAVEPDSPAAQAGLRGGAEAGSDVIVAVDGAPVSSPEGLAFAVQRHAPGETVRLLLLSAGKFREVPIAVRALPDSTRPRRERVLRSTPTPARPKVAPNPY